MPGSIHTIFPGGRPLGFFDIQNIEFIQSKISHVLSIEFKQNVIVDIASIKRIMQRVVEERIEAIPKMNQRVVMYITNEFRNHQLTANKHLNWEGHYFQSQRLYDPTVERGPFLTGIKLKNRLGKPRVGGTTRFYFT
jgi:hypothetical protein